MKNHVGLADSIQKLQNPVSASHGMLVQYWKTGALFLSSLFLYKDLYGDWGIDCRDRLGYVRKFFIIIIICAIRILNMRNFDVNFEL